MVRQNWLEGRQAWCSTTAANRALHKQQAMSLRLRARLQADEFSSIDFNVDDSQSEEGQTGLIHAAAAAVEETTSASDAPDMQLHQAQEGWIAVAKARRV